jgi:hypothetical protein
MLFPLPQGEGQGEGEPEKCSVASLRPDCAARQATRDFGFRLSSFLRASDFEFRICALVFSLFLLIPQRAPACGPFFPNNMLDRGDAAVLDAPTADFARELERMALVPTRFQAKRTDGTFAEQTQDAELVDLAGALKKAQRPTEDAARVIALHRVQRDRLHKFKADYETWSASGEWVWLEAGPRRTEPGGPPPEFTEFAPVEGLPGEFNDYFEGAVAWHNPALANKGLAREAWERLLERPAAERKFKSTWAAFMLGKSWEDEDPDKAAELFQQVRELAKRGFADSLGLAAASLGLEARIRFHEGDYAQAIRLYLEQFATGDSTAGNSLRMVAADALEDAEVLHDLARDPQSQRVITAYLISKSWPSWRMESEENPNQPDATTTRWLDAVEAAGLSDVDSAEKLALAAYRAGDCDAAQRWIKRAPGSAVADWLQAKLFLRAGKVSQAAALLAKVSRSLPLESRGTNVSTTFAENLFVVVNAEYRDHIPVGHQALAELGTVRLARREFTEALDALLRSGYWMDAAYVAERVLTADELKTYVDREWPPGLASPATEDQERAEVQCSDKVLGQNIRYLLGRRLTRLNRGFEARDYFPAEWQPPFDALTQALDAGWDESQPTNARAAALFTAAFIARTNGMELLGTEVAPDWHIHGGNFEEGISASLRPTEETSVLRASPEELRRAASHKADPETRFHYRYQAAFLAWEAAKLMSNNSDETARVLCIAGSWIKNRDPETADIFYKSLVRRCRKTAIGDLADRKRWFPILDANGNPEPWEPPVVNYDSEKEEPSPARELKPDEPETIGDPDVRMMEEESRSTGHEYVIHKGDTLAKIVAACNAMGIYITLAELLEVNPGMDPARLKVGQKILVPAGKSEAMEAEPLE